LRVAEFFDVADQPGLTLFLGWRNKVQCRVNVTAVGKKSIPSGRIFQDLPELPNVACPSNRRSWFREVRELLRNFINLAELIDLSHRDA
jgi:hypothetical protein